MFCFMDESKVNCGLLVGRHASVAVVATGHVAVHDGKTRKMAFFLSHSSKTTSSQHEYFFFFLDNYTQTRSFSVSFFQCDALKCAQKQGDGHPARDSVPVLLFKGALNGVDTEMLRLTAKSELAHSGGAAASCREEDEVRESLGVVFGFKRVNTIKVHSTFLTRNKRLHIKSTHTRHIWPQPGSLGRGGPCCLRVTKIIP